MLAKKLKPLKLAVVLAAGVIALTSCTNASQTGSPSQTSGAAAFDPASISKDSTLAAQVPDAIKSKGTLVIGSDTSYAPAEFLGGSDGQTPMGYDVDIARAIGATLGLKVEIHTSDFTTILPSLGPKYDLGVSSFFITKERSKAANFVSYFQAGTQWAVQKGNPKDVSVDDLCGKSVGVQTGTFQEDPDVSGRSAKCVSEGKEPINVVPLKNQTDITTRLVAGSLDAMAAGSVTVAYAISQTDGQLQTLGDVYGASPLGIAVAKDDVPLAEVIAKSINQLIQDGDYKKILDSWGNGTGAVDQAQVNPVTSK